MTYEGYEVENGDTNDSFLLAFEDLSNAINFCISFQINLLRISWPEAITSLPEYGFQLCILYNYSLIQYYRGARIEDSRGGVKWNGLRVKMAVHAGVSNSAIDITTGRTRYVCFFLILFCFAHILISFAVWPCDSENQKDPYFLSN